MAALFTKFLGFNEVSNLYFCVLVHLGQRKMDNLEG